MLLRLRLLLASLGGGALLVLLLCLGAQNLDRRVSLNLGFGRSAELPTGFLVGLALAVGVISGGTAAALLLPGRDQGSGRAHASRADGEHAHAHSSPNRSDSSGVRGFHCVPSLASCRRRAMADNASRTTRLPSMAVMSAWS